MHCFIKIRYSGTKCNAKHVRKGSMEGSFLWFALLIWFKCSRNTGDINIYSVQSITIKEFKSPAMTKDLKLTTVLSVTATKNTIKRQP